MPNLPTSKPSQFIQGAPVLQALDSGPEVLLDRLAMLY
jgi:hypothetical protein